MSGRLLTCTKLDDDPDDLLSRIATAIKSIKPSRRWSERIILGCWNVSYVSKALIR